LSGRNQDDINNMYGNFIFPVNINDINEIYSHNFLLVNIGNRDENNYIIDNLKCDQTTLYTRDDQTI